VGVVSTYGVLVALHVVVAVVGIGMVGAIPLGARVARRAGADLAALEPFYTRLYRITGTSLFVMLFSGLALDALVSGIHHERDWFKAAVVLWLVAGFCLGRTRARFRRGSLLGVEVFGWATAASVLAIAVLMKLKPF
jgi:hypothetical protein